MWSGRRKCGVVETEVSEVDESSVSCRTDPYISTEVTEVETRVAKSVED